MTDRTAGWALVGIQIVLLVLLVVVPRSDDWPTPEWLEVLGIVIAVVGGAVVLGAGRHLGSALTPTPVPRAGAELATAGWYRHVRHPIYSGVLLVVLGVVIRSGSLATLAVGALTGCFFRAKASWEERRLRQRHPDYAAYAATTPRFLPRPWARPTDR